MTTGPGRIQPTPAADPERDLIISVRGLVKTFPSPRGERVRVLDGVSFDIPRGECLVIMGGSGCGKSTLLNCLIGELAADGGQILYRLKGEPAPLDIAQLDEAAMNRLRRRFGILFQSGALLNSLTVEGNVALPLREHTELDREIIRIMVALKLEQVRMLPHREKLPAQLSGGQRKRAALARALALDPEILYYDEPSAGLDPVTSAAIDELIVDLTKKLNVTSVVVTHEMDSAFRIADQMVMLDRGCVLRTGPRGDFQRIRQERAERLASREDRLIHQFLNGLPGGPLGEGEDQDAFEQILAAGEE